MTRTDSTLTSIVYDERGMALAVALFALVIVGALVGSALFAGAQEQRAGDSTRRLQQAFGVAELGIYDVVRTWNPNTYNQRGAYPTDSVGVPNPLVQGTTPRATGSFGGYVYRLNDQIYLIDVTGHDTVSGTGSSRSGDARQRLGLLARIKPLQVNVGAALTNGGGGITLSGNAHVIGQDALPPGWTNCPPPGPSLAGIRTLGTVSTTGIAGATGSPAVMQDSTVRDSSTFTVFGDVTWADLVAQASVQLPTGSYSAAPLVNADGTCNKTVTTNWGDALNPSGGCGRYFPIIYINGNGQQSGGQGQGILLVNGDFASNGGSTFDGLVIVRGKLTSSGGGAHFNGAVLAQNSALASSAISGSTTVNYSSCALLQALSVTGKPAMFRSRGWVQLF